MNLNYPLKLFSKLMRGISLNVHVQSPSYTGPTIPQFIQHLTLHTPDTPRLTKYIDVSAVLVFQETDIRVAVVNRHETESFVARFAFGPKVEVDKRVKVYAVWSENLGDGNSFEGKKVGVFWMRTGSGY